MEAAVTSGPDFSDVTSVARAEERVQRGELEKLYLLPAEFGGTNDPRNVVYVPKGFAEIKSDIDSNIVMPLVALGKVTKYVAIPEYQCKSIVPIVIKVTASSPSNFTSEIIIWGNALTGGKEPNK